MRKVASLMMIALFLGNCSADSDLAEILGPSISINLTFPENLSECTEGTLVSETESELTFLWEGIDRVQTYKMTLTNLNTFNIQEFESDEPQLNVILKRATPYSWSISSASSPNKIRSETWSFYNEGPGSESFVPSPATAISPASGASISATATTVNLRWNAEDPDEDIVEYDLYFGEDNDPPLFESDLENDQFLGIPVEAGKTYYWKVITKDSQGNESISPIFSFTVG